MKKPLIALLFVVSQCAFADTIPPSIENVIAGTDTREHSLQKGELTIRYGRPKVTQEMAGSMLDWICNDYFMNKWKPETIKKITLLNITRDQGYKINAGGAECEKSGFMHSEKRKTYIQNAEQL